MAEYNQRFESFQQWVSKASSWLTRHPNYHPEKFRAVCFDAKGRQCRMGRDFMLARDEEAFPVGWLWPDQVARNGWDVLRNETETEREKPNSSQLRD